MWRGWEAIGERAVTCGDCHGCGGASEWLRCGVGAVLVMVTVLVVERKRADRRPSTEEMPLSGVKAGQHSPFHSDLDRRELFADPLTPSKVSDAALPLVLISHNEILKGDQAPPTSYVQREERFCSLQTLSLPSYAAGFWQTIHAL